MRGCHNENCWTLRVSALPNPRECAYCASVMPRLAEWTLAAALALSLGPHGVSAAGTAIVSLTPTADTGLLEFKPDYNLGANLDLPSGTLGVPAGQTRSRMLLRFDLSSIPSSSRITAARLRVVVTRSPDGAGSTVLFGMHRILRPWTEGTQHGDPPGGGVGHEGESTWVHRLIPRDTWGTPGGQEGVDYLAEPGSTERVGGPGAYEFEFGADELGHLQRWLQHPEENLGWMLRSQVEETARAARRFGAREHQDPSTRPALILTLETSPGPTPPAITGFQWDGSLAQVHLTAEPNIRYALEYSPLPRGAPWSPAGSTASTNQPGTVTLTDQPGPATKRFYRVAAQP